MIKGYMFKKLIRKIQKNQDPVRGLEGLIEEDIKARINFLVASGNYELLEELTGNFNKLADRTKLSVKYVYGKELEKNTKQIGKSKLPFKKLNIADFLGYGDISDVDRISIEELKSKYNNPIFENLWERIKDEKFYHIYENKDAFAIAKLFAAFSGIRAANINDNSFYMVYYDRYNNGKYYCDSYIVAYGRSTKSPNNSSAYLEIGRIIEKELYFNDFFKFKLVEHQKFTSSNGI